MVRPSVTRALSQRSNGEKMAKSRPEWVEVGRRIDFEIEARGRRRVVEVPDSWRLVSDGRDIFLVEVIRKNPISRATKSAWRDWTLGSPVDEVTTGKRPIHGPWKRRGKITRVWYDGRLQEQAEGPSRRVHKFENPYPVLQSGKNGPRILRGASEYRWTDRGIVG